MLCISEDYNHFKARFARQQSLKISHFLDGGRAFGKEWLLGFQEECEMILWKKVYKQGFCTELTQRNREPSERVHRWSRLSHSTNQVKFTAATNQQRQAHDPLRLPCWQSVGGKNMCERGLTAKAIKKKNPSFDKAQCIIFMSIVQHVPLHTNVWKYFKLFWSEYVRYDE